MAARKGGAQPGNQHAVKLKEPDTKAEAYRQYCEWIGKGNCKEAWVFEHPEMTLTHKTMEKYIKENPHDFPAIKKERAESKSYEHWIGLGKDMMTGQIPKCQPAIYQMFMRNKFGWDKESTTKISASPEMDAKFDRVMKMLEDEQQKPKE